MISKGAAKRFKNEHKQQASIAKFKHRFPQQSFEKYRQSMICETMLYASGEGKVSGFVIKPKHIDDKLPVVVYNRGGNGAYGRVNMADKLKALNRTHKLVLYRGDDHSLNQNRDAALQIVIDWFKQHL